MTRLSTIRITTALVLLSATPGSAQTLTPTEQKMRQWVAAHTQEEIDYLAKVVNINSGTFNLPGVKAVRP